MAEILTPDLCIIGGGSAGLAVAERARALGASVVIVEKARLGGSALHTGSVPATALSAAAAHAHAMRNGAAFGILADEIRVNFRRVHDHVDQVISAVSPARAVPRFEALGVRIIEAEGRFVDRRTLAAGEVQVRARRFVIATGARQRPPAVPGLDAVPHFTLETILDNTRKLSHLVVIGGGAVGLAVAQAYRRLGSDVTVVETGAFLPDSDPELAAVALKALAEEGVALLPQSTVAAIQPRSMGIGVVVRSSKGETLLDVSHILVATECVPDLEHLDLRNAGVARSGADATRLRLLPGLRTTNPRIHVVGDATGEPASVQAAAEQARIVTRAALLGLPPWFDPPRPLVRVVHTEPGLAEVGLTEAEARARYKDRFRVTRVPFADNDRARAARRPHGLAKVLTTPQGRLLGAGVAGAGAGELIALFSLAIARNMSITDLDAFSAPYATFAEIANRLAETAATAGPDPLTGAWLKLNRLLR